jgi:hypothetical protein
MDALENSRTIRVRCRALRLKAYVLVAYSRALRMPDATPQKAGFAVSAVVAAFLAVEWTCTDCIAGPSALMVPRVVDALDSLGRALKIESQSAPCEACKRVTVVHRLV